MAGLPKTLPKTPREWHGYISSHGLIDETIHSAKLASASNVGFDQFLLFRVLWKKYEGDHSLLYTLLGLQKYVTQATEKLAEYKSWSTYCGSFGSGGVNAEGTFAIARHYQLEVAKTKEEADPGVFCTPVAKRTRAQQQQKQLVTGMAKLQLETPTKPSSKKATGLFDKALSLKTPKSPFNFEEDEDEEPSPFQPVSPISAEMASVLYPPTKDEQIVNTALIVFLNALTIHFIFALNWTLHRIGFKAVFEAAQFEARTDGYLDDHQGKPAVLVEVKPVMRSTKLVQIQVQESAQMVAWIKSDDDVTQKRHKTRVHVSQDRNEVFVTVAEYDEDYLDYLNNPQSSKKKSPSFLTMHQFGPWNTLDVSQMRDLGPLLLAITLRAEEESNKSSPR